MERKLPLIPNRIETSTIKEIDEHITDHKYNLDQILYGNGRYRYDTNRTILLSNVCSIVKGLLQLYFSLFYAIDLKTVLLSKKSVFKSKKTPVFQGLLIV